MYPYQHTISLGLRFMRLFKASPAFISWQLRSLYRYNYGIPQDRERGDGLSGAPLRVQFHLTRRCNLKCFMCQQNREDEGPPPEMQYYDPKRELPISAWTGILDQVAKYRPEIHVIGGEPTMYKRYVDFIAEAKKRRLVVNLQTNGTMLDRSAEDLVRLGLDVVTVSLDGPEDIHDEIRGVKGAFERTVGGIEAVLEARKRLNRPGPIVAVNSVISKVSMDQLPRVVRLSSDLGVDIQQITHTFFDSPENVAHHNRIFPAAFDRDKELELIVSPSILPWEYYENELGKDDIPSLMAILQQIRWAARDRIHLVFFPNLPDRMVPPYYLHLNHPFRQICNSPWSSATILPDGSLQSCFHIKNGNLTEQPFMKVWNGPPMRKFRQIIGKRLLPGCARCCSRSFAAC